MPENQKQPSPVETHFYDRGGRHPQDYVRVADVVEVAPAIAEQATATLAPAIAAEVARQLAQLAAAPKPAPKSPAKKRAAR